MADTVNHDQSGSSEDRQTSPTAVPSAPPGAVPDQPPSAPATLGRATAAYVRLVAPVVDAAKDIGRMPLTADEAHSLLCEAAHLHYWATGNRRGSPASTPFTTGRPKYAHRPGTDWPARR